MSYACPSLIIVSGPPGSGKTTLARKLSTDLGVLMLAKDELKEIIWDSTGYDHEGRSKVAHAAYAIMFKYARELLAAGTNCLLESNFAKNLVSQDFLTLQNATQCRVIEVHCIAPFDTLRERVVQRCASGKRHEGHCDDAMGMNYETFYLPAKDPLGIADIEISVDPVSDAFRYEQLLGKIREFLSVYGS